MTHFRRAPRKWPMLLRGHLLLPEDLELVRPFVVVPP